MVGIAVFITAELFLDPILVNKVEILEVFFTFSSWLWLWEKLLEFFSSVVITSDWINEFIEFFLEVLVDLLLLLSEVFFEFFFWVVFQEELA
jgi:hypothetical protein